MKPFMRDVVVIYVPVIDEKGKPILNKYSKPLVTPITTKARVRKTTTAQVSNKGNLLDGLVEIDIPREQGDIPKGARVEFADAQGYQGVGHVQSVQTSVNLSGSRIEFRTLMVDISD